MTEKCLFMTFLLQCLIQQSEEISGAPDKLQFLLQMIWIGDSLTVFTVAAFLLSSVYMSHYYRLVHVGHKDRK